MESDIGKKRRFKKPSTTQLIAVGFFLAIIVGGIVLSLPICSADGSFTPFIDALFTSTTSVCVTGLVTVVTASHWSLFGQFVILLLIQLGGLGVVAVAVTFWVIMGRRITLKERMLIQEAYNLDALSGTVKIILRIVKVTLIIEAIGAVIYAVKLVPQFGLFEGLWYSIFNSVSAFCNAGMDVIAEDSLQQYVVSPLMNFTTAALIILGGIGFTVWWDVARVIRENGVIKSGPRKLFWKLMVHSKLAILMTVILLAVGTIGFFALEYTNPQTLGGMSVFGKFQAAMFQSVTTRTAGFFSIPQDQLRDASALLSIMLMLIGGSPAGTAGGIKTTTIGMIAFTVLSVMRGKKDTEIFSRKIPNDNVRSGLAVLGVFLLIFMVSSIALMAVDNLGFLDSMFEVTSALATVGLSRGITPSLSVIGKLIIILTMYMGRIGPITVVLILHVKKNDKASMKSLPEKRILIG